MTESDSIEVATEGTQNTIENNIESDIKAASEAGEGSLDEICGIYAYRSANGEIIDGVSYVFDSGQMYLVKIGSYEMGNGEITMKCAGISEDPFVVAESSEGYNLMSGENVIIPLVYVDGTNGLGGSDKFDGFYYMDGIGYKFSNDGSFIVIEKTSYIANEDTITIGFSEYDWDSENGEICISTDGVVEMSLIPKKII